LECRELFEIGAYMKEWKEIASVQAPASIKKKTKKRKKEMPDIAHKGAFI